MTEEGIPPVVAGARALRLDAGQATTPIALTRWRDEDGAWHLRAEAPGARALILELPCTLNEHIAGFGERFMQVDKRGHRIEGWVGLSRLGASRHGKGFDGGYKVAPVWFSSTGYAAVLDSTRRWTVDVALGDPERIVVTDPGESIDVLVIPGPPKQALPVLTARYGRAPLPAPWVFGVWKASRGGQAATLAEARALRQAGIGCSAIWLDAHWQPQTNSGFPAAGGYPLGDYGSIAETVAALHALGFKVLSYVNPFLYAGTPAYDEALQRGFAVRDADGQPLHVTAIHPLDGDVYGIAERAGIHSSDRVAQVDFTNPEAVQWWTDLLRRILTEEGFDGWMEDFGEDIPADARFHDGGTGLTHHNAYPVMYHRAAAEALATKPGAASFSRSAYLGSTRYCAVLWPGDQTRDWSRDSGIGAVPAAGITIGLLGASAWGPDIGAVMDFADLGDGRGGGSDDEELYLRWCQLGAMSPVMRDHLGFFRPGAVDLWTSESTQDAWRRWAAWHLRLFPYLYGHAAQAAREGLPILRGLMIEFPEDPRSWLTTDAYLLGDALLCAPVLERGARTRDVVLPAGSWWDPVTGDRYAGGTRVTLPAPLDRLPVLQRGGTVVPYLTETPDHLCDERWARGEFDLELRVAGRAEKPVVRLLADGTRIELVGATVTVTGGPRRRYVLAGPTGDPLAEATGTDVTLG